MKHQNLFVGRSQLPLEELEQRVYISRYKVFGRTHWSAVKLCKFVHLEVKKTCKIMHFYPKALCSHPAKKAIYLLKTLTLTRFGALTPKSYLCISKFDHDRSSCPVRIYSTDPLKTRLRMQLPSLLRDIAWVCYPT